MLHKTWAWFDGCFWGQLYFGNISEWVFSKTAAKIQSFQENGYTYFTFLTVMPCQRGTNLYGSFSSKCFGKKCKHIELALNFIQKQYFS